MLNKENYSELFVLFLILLFSLVFPVIIFPLASVFGQSEIVEEIIKGLMVFLVIRKLSGKKNQVLAAVAAGCLIGLSESLFSLPRIFEDLGGTGFFEKILFTVPLHMATIVFILLASMKNKWLVVPGVAASIVIHLFFNKYLIYWL